MRLYPRTDLITTYTRRFSNRYTRTAYANDLRSFARFTLNRDWITPALLKRITHRHLLDYVGYLMESARTFSIIMRRLSILERFLKWAAQQGYTDQSLVETLHEAFRKHVRPIHTHA